MIDEEYFDSTKVIVNIIDKSIADDMIVKYHYSHAKTSNRYSFGIYYKTPNKFFGDDNLSLIGCIIYGSPVGRLVTQSISPELKDDETLELTRLFIHDGYGKNIESYSVSQSFKLLKKIDKTIKCIISYSDPEQNHVGTIYQSLNFSYQGDTTRIVDAFWLRVDEDSEWIHPRTLFATFGTINLKEIREKIGHGFYIKDLLRKHRYVYFLCSKPERNKIIKTIKHPFLPYPKKIENHEEKIRKID